jgi:hypothetical protein
VPIVDLGLSDRDVVVSCKDIATDRVIQPGDVDLAGTGGATTVRIWMPTSSINLIVAIVG